jgi:hypothetical protein
VEIDLSPSDIAHLAHCHVVAIAESILPPRVFRPARKYWSERRPKPLSRRELLELVTAFDGDRAFRDWVQAGASPEQVFALWDAIAQLQRGFELFDGDSEVPDPAVVEEIRSRPSARAVFGLAVRRSADAAIIVD